MSCVHLDDVGTIFKIKLVDCETGYAIDISAATTKTIRFQLSDGSFVSKPAEFSTDGTDGYIEYAAEPGFLSQTGRWKIQGFVIAGGFENSSSVEEFKVFSNLS